MNHKTQDKQCTCDCRFCKVGAHDFDCKPIPQSDEIMPTTGIAHVKSDEGTEDLVNKFMVFLNNYNSEKDDHGVIRKQFTNLIALARKQEQEVQYQIGYDDGHKNGWEERGKQEREELLKEYDKVFSEGHGGGNFRRLIEIFREKLKAIRA